MPKIEHKDGYYQVSNTGVENLGAFLGNFVPQLLSGIEKKKEHEIKVQNLVEDFNKRVTAFENMDPEKQEEMKKRNPKLVEAIYDDSAILKLQRKKLPKDYKAEVPTTRTLTTTEQADKDKKIAEAKKVAAEAEGAEDKTALEKIVFEKRRGYLTDPKDKIEEFYGLAGDLPSSTDQFEAFIMSDEEQKKKSRQDIVGTIEYKTKLAEKEMAALRDKYDLKNPKEVEAVRGLANYIAGLNDSFPANLPKSLQAKQNEYEERRIRNSEERLGFDRKQAARSQFETQVKLVRDLMANGMEFKAANEAVDRGLKTGQWDPNIPLPKDKDAELKTKLDEAKLEIDKAKIQEAAILNPKVQVMLTDLNARMRSASINGETINVDPYLKKIYDAAGIKLPAAPPAKESGGWQAWLNGLLGGAGVKAPAGSTFPRAPMMQGQGPAPRAPGAAAPTGAMSTTPAASTGTAVRDLGPEINSALANQIQNFDAMLRNDSLRDEDRKRIEESRAALAAAVQSGNEAEIRRILLGGR